MYDFLGNGVGEIGKCVIGNIFDIFGNGLVNIVSFS